MAKVIKNIRVGDDLNTKHIDMLFVEQIAGGKEVVVAMRVFALNEEQEELLSRINKAISEVKGMGEFEVKKHTQKK